MKKYRFFIFEGILLLVSIAFFISYGVLLHFCYEKGLTSILLAIAILALLVSLFFLVMRLFASSKLPEVKKGIICPRCHYPNEEGSKVCKQCGYKLNQKKDKDSINKDN